jgi:uncharacterized membrane protein
MPPILQEWLNLILRWAHVIAAIMWIGDSFLFMWLDSSLARPAKPRPGDVVGELWMTHSGGFYEVVKHRSLATLPERLYWFMWQSYSTWLTGLALLLVVFGLGGRAMLLDLGSPLSHGAGLALALGVLAAGVALYEALCRVPRLAGHAAFAAIGLAAIAALAWGLGRVFTPRAAFLLAGATLGTIMTANVFLAIIPAQRRMVAATRAGREVDTTHGARAKQRSTHNHYLTLPVLFTMVSNHFPSLYGHPHAWTLLALLAVLGAGVKAIMHLRGRTPWPVWAASLASLAALAALTAPAGESAAARALASHAPVATAEAQTIVRTRCVTCHAAKPSEPAFPAPPSGVMLESPEQMKAYAERILVRVYETRTMPLGNLTGMTDEERVVLGAWARQQRGR